MAPEAGPRPPRAAAAARSDLIHPTFGEPAAAGDERCWARPTDVQTGPFLSGVQVGAEHGADVRDGLVVRLQVWLGDGQRAVARHLPQDVDRDAGSRRSTYR